MSNLHANLIKVIDQHLTKRKMKWSELGLKIGRTRGRMSQIRNHNGQINLVVLEKIAAVLSVPMWRIVKEAETMGDK